MCRASTARPSFPFRHHRGTGETQPVFDHQLPFRASFLYNRAAPLEQHPEIFVSQLPQEKAYTSNRGMTGLGSNITKQVTGAE